MSPEGNNLRYPRPTVGVVVVENRRLLLVRRAKEPYKDCWTIPGGKVEWGEGLVQAAAREALEETGLTVKIGELIWIGQAIGPDAAHPTFHNILIDFTASIVDGVLAAGTDAAEVVFIQLEDVRNLPLTPTMYELLDILDSPRNQYAPASAAVEA